MKLQLADKPGFTARLLQVGKIISAPYWLASKTAWITFWNNMPAAEKARQTSNLFTVKQDLNQLAGRDLFNKMDFDKADFLLEKLPLVIEDTNRKFAATAAHKLGDKRVLSRYLKSQNQILDEVYAWGVRNAPPDGNTTALPPPPDTQPNDPSQPAFPGSPGISKPWYKNPVYLLAAGAAAFFVLPKLYKR
jgi:hypothetical protein